MKMFAVGYFCKNGTFNVIKSFKDIEKAKKLMIKEQNKYTYKLDIKVIYE